MRGERYEAFFDAWCHFWAYAIPILVALIFLLSILYPCSS
jgi:hypothetical protein